MRVYISSPFLDLKGCRAKAYDALRRIGVDALGMEDYVASDDRPVDKCLGDVREADAYVGLLAWRYGSIPDGAACSVTELEYKTAVSENKPRLLFLLHPEASWPRNNVDRDPARIDALRAEWEGSRIVSHFQNCDELGALVTAAIARRLLEERDRTRPESHDDDDDDERRSLQLQLDEIKRQLQVLTQRITPAEERAIAPGERQAIEASTQISLPRAASTVSAAQTKAPRRSTLGKRWFGGGAVLAAVVALVLFVQTRSGNGTKAPGHVQVDTVPIITPSPPADTQRPISVPPTKSPPADSARSDSGSNPADTARPDSVVISRMEAPGLLGYLIGFAALLVIVGLSTTRRMSRPPENIDRSPRDAVEHTGEHETPAARDDEGPEFGRSIHTREYRAPAEMQPQNVRSPALKSLAERNRDFVHETQRIVQSRLEGLGSPPQD